jgi:hypothetical protein
MKFWLLIFTYSLILVIFYSIFMEIYALLFFKIAELNSRLLIIVLTKTIFICLMFIFGLGLFFTELLIGAKGLVLQANTSIVCLCWIGCFWISLLNFFRRHGKRLKSLGYFEI